MIYQKSNSTGKYFFEIIRYNNFEFDEHFHRHYEIVYAREGEIIVNFESKTELIKAGECAFIASNTIHSYKTESHSVADVCIFSADFVPMFASEIKRKHPDSCKFVCKKSVLNFAISELFNPDKTPDLYTTKSALYAVCGEILKNIKFEVSTFKKDILIDRLIEYVSLNFKENISLETASAALGYEKHYLSRCFHSVIPMNFSKFVNSLRIDYATELMQYSNLTIAEIALESGFQSVRTFNRIFLNLTGKTPSEYY